jgi:hypothetical protein
MPKYLIIILLFFGNIVSSFAQKKQIYLCNLTDKAHHYLRQNPTDIATYLFDFAKQKQIKAYLWDNSKTYQILADTALENRMQTVSHIGVEVEIAANETTRNITFLHLFSDSVSIAMPFADKYIASFRFSEFVQAWNMQKVAKPLLWLNSKVEIVDFRAMVNLNDLATQEKIIKILATATQKSQIRPFYKFSTSKTLPTNSLKFLEQIANSQQNMLDKYCFLNVKETLEGQVFFPKSIDLFDEGTAENQYTSTYYGSFVWEDVQNLLATQIPTFAKDLTACSLPEVLAIRYANMPLMMDFRHKLTTDSTKKIEQMVVKTFDLREAANAKLQRKRKEISRLLLQASLAGEISAYQITQTKDSISSNVVNKEELLEILRIKNIEENTDTKDKNTKLLPKKDKLYHKFNGFYYSPKNLYLLQACQKISYDASFFKTATKTAYIAIVLPANLSPKGLEETLCWFKAEDCQKIFANNRKAKFQKNTNYLQAINLELLEGTIWEGTGFFEK